MIQPVLHDESGQIGACVYCEHYCFDVAGINVTRVCINFCVCGVGGGGRVRLVSKDTH